VSEFKNNPNLRPSRGTALRRLSLRPDPELLAESEGFSAPQTPSLGRILDVDEIANLFGKSRETVKRKFRLRKLHGFKFGRSWYAREADLQRDIWHALESDGQSHREEEEE
jgi:hypothetical protein